MHNAANKRQRIRRTFLYKKGFTASRLLSTKTTKKQTN